MNPAPAPANRPHENELETTRSCELGATCATSSTPRTDALEVPILETRANAIMAFQIMVEHAKKMERYYETASKDSLFLLKVLTRVVAERDALMCCCSVRNITSWGGDNYDVPSCPKCGKMRNPSRENSEISGGIPSAASEVLQLKSQPS